MNICHRLGIFVLGSVLLFAGVSAAQQPSGGDSQAPPATASSSGQAGMTAPAQEVAPAPATSGAADLSGPEEFSPGTVGNQFNYLLPSLQISGTADSNANIGGGRQEFESVERLGTRLAFQHVSRRSRTTGDYRGTGVIYNQHSNLNTTMHQFGITHSYQGRRWNWTLDERASYLPESAFGLGGMGWGGDLGISLGGALGSNLGSLNPAFNSGQSIYTSRGDRVSNVASLQIGYAASRRSSISLTTSFGLLHFRTPGAIDSRSAMIDLGYSHALSARDTVGIDYGVSLFRFQHVGESFVTHVIEFNYGHRLTGKLAMQASAGAQVSVFNNPLVGSGTLPSWNARTSLNYQRAHNAFAFSYSRYISNGGGVFVGSQRDLLYFSWSRHLTRHWAGTLGPGYSRNRSLRQTAGGTTQSVYNSYYVNASVSRALGPFMSMFLSYDLQGQSLSAGSCVGSNCRSTYLRHMFSFGFDWHRRPLLIE